ncbi:uncharacterized protein LOC132549675 [Ylistrum balloti]|uniref:uncharacterized protein LOC132549675 n=1 Tax=Ylistrum balloti TaxID=509963 RepID=UPI002905CEC7|nr:uncharacterized protein LOC132549675 [Ylistrum balloti]
MESVMTEKSSDRINNALATLRSEMLDLRQQDIKLMKQLVSINDSIKSLTKRRSNPGRPMKKKFSLVKGRRKFINLNESIPEEDSSSDSDDSLCSTENDM